MKKGMPAIGLLSVLLQACGSSTSPPTPSRVVVTPSSATLESLGDTQNFSARVENKKGKEIAGATVTWASSDSTVASVSSTGVATALKAGTVQITADADGMTGLGVLIITPVPAALAKVAGDAQVGSIQSPLQVDPTVEVMDGNGHPVVGAQVTFSVLAGGGSVSSNSVTTGSDGRASTSWQLGCTSVSPQQLGATASGLSVVFTATANVSELAICPQAIPDGRATLPYSVGLSAVGGDQGSLVWSVSPGGTLPAGITLHPDGLLSGVPTEKGAYVFSAQVQDGSGHSASRELQLRICEAPLSLSPGESQVMVPSGTGGCGFFLPSGANGDRYRLGVVYASPDTVSSDVLTVTVDMTRQTAPGAPSQAASPLPVQGPAARAQEVPPGAPFVVPGLEEALRIAEATEALHRRIRLAERELIRSLGPNARPLPDRRRLAMVPGPRAPSPDKMSFTNPTNFNSCALGETRTAIKVGENDLMVIYQDSIQRASTPMSSADAQSMLDYFRDYGQQVIDDYFEGITDLDGNGKIDVFVTPVVQSGTAAFVWSGDFFPKVTEGNWQGCPASNEMELIRFSLSVIQGMDSGNYQAVGTVVHESKHISSLYKSIIRQSDPAVPGGYEPLWVEEGTAEIAAEMSSRLAWEAVGGPAVGARVKASDFPANTDFTEENFGIILRAARVVGYLTSQPNGVVTTPAGAGSDHSVYGSGWHFHRWLGDAYGNASTRLGDASMFRTLVDSMTATGVLGIQSVTGGESWEELMDEYVKAIMVNGTSAPAGPHEFTTYNFPSLNKAFTYDGKPEGNYPWPVNVSAQDSTALFATSTNTGPIGPSGIRVLDLTSDGTGLGLEVKVSSTFSTYPVRIVVVRIH